MITSSIAPVQVTDKLTFSCRCCGACCRHVKDSIMLDARDAHRLGHYLREHTNDIHNIEDVYNKYAEVGAQVEGYPVYLLNTCGKDDACVFLKDGRCSVYEARPGVCRLYPLTANTDSGGKEVAFYQCIDRHKAHFNGGEWNIKEWVKQNFSAEARAYLVEDSEVLLKLGDLMRKFGKQREREYLFPLLYYRYFNYELDTPFMWQYRRNQQTLLEDLRQRLQRQV